MANTLNTCVADTFWNLWMVWGIKTIDPFFFFFSNPVHCVATETIQLGQKFSLTNLCTITRGHLQKRLVKKWSGFRSWRRFQPDFQFCMTPFLLITKNEKSSLCLLELSWHQYDCRLVCCSQAGHFILLDINSQSIYLWLRQHYSDKETKPLDYFFKHTQKVTVPPTESPSRTAPAPGSVKSKGNSCFLCLPQPAIPGNLPDRWGLSLILMC